MKTLKAVCAVSLLWGLFLGGCCDRQTRPEATVIPIDKDAVNRAIVGVYSDQAVENAVLAQHTLYPYHFVDNSAALNPIGQRDLDILIRFYKENPGRLIVQQGDVEMPLYQARREAVYERMVQAGIPQGAIRITEGMPGGDGMSSGSVIDVLIKSREKPETSRYEGGAARVVF
jgi:hypothetical protein